MVNCSIDLDLAVISFPLEIWSGFDDFSKTHLLPFKSISSHHLRKKHLFHWKTKIYLWIICEMYDVIFFVAIYQNLFQKSSIKVKGYDN